MRFPNRRFALIAGNNGDFLGAMKDSFIRESAIIVIKKLSLFTAQKYLSLCFAKAVGGQINGIL